MRGARRSRGTRRSRAAASRAGSARREPRARIPTVRGASRTRDEGSREAGAKAKGRRTAARRARDRAARARRNGRSARREPRARRARKRASSRRAGETRGWKTLVLRDRFSAPERTPGPPAPPRARTVPRRDRDRANVPDRAANVELLTLRARRCVAARARRAEKREHGQKKRDRLFEKQNTRVCSGYWCPYTGRRESNDRFRGGGGCLRRRGGRRAGARAPAAVALDGEEGPEVDRGHARAGRARWGEGARASEVCGVRHARKGRPVDVES